MLSHARQCSHSSSQRHDTFTYTISSPSSSRAHSCSSLRSNPCISAPSRDSGAISAFCFNSRPIIWSLHPCRVISLICSACVIVMGVLPLPGPVPPAAPVKMRTMESLRFATEVEGGGTACGVLNCGRGGKVLSINSGARPPPGASPECALVPLILTRVIRARTTAQQRG